MKASQFRKVLAELAATPPPEGTSTYEFTDVLGGARKPNHKAQPAQADRPAEPAHPGSPPDALAALDWGPLEPSLDGSTLQIVAPPLWAGQMVFVCLAHPSEERAHSRVGKPTPFYRAFTAARAVTDAEACARAFLAIAVRLSRGAAVPLCETCLHNADISARRLPRGGQRDALEALIDFLRTAAPGEGGVAPVAEPTWQDGNYRGRFAVLRAVGAERAVARFPAATFLEVLDQGWLPVWKAIGSPAEVEVAPGLLRQSLVEALSGDPDSAAGWRTWLDVQLARNSLLHDEMRQLFHTGLTAAR
jgi:hypothetical protein